MEEFEIALGADAAVKVEYKPVRKLQQTSGMLSKSRVYSYHQIIEVKNTKSDSIIVTVTDQLPRSCNDKIKVGLLYSILSLHKKFLQIIVHKIIVFRNVHWVFMEGCLQQYLLTQSLTP